MKPAMVFAAGMGQRLRPLTLTTPKPLLQVGGRSLLDRILDQLVADGFAPIIVNAYYLAEQIEAAIAARCDARIIVSREYAPLETGGGLLQARPMLGASPWLIVNSDNLYPPAPNQPSIFTQAWQRFNPALMQGQLSLVASATMHGTTVHDYALAADGRLQKTTTPTYAYCGVGVLQPATLLAAPSTAFSLSRIFQQGVAAGSFYGWVYSGTWWHISTPTDFTAAAAWWQRHGA